MPIMKKKPECTTFTVRLPKALMEKFEDKCIEKFETRSEALRAFIKEYIKETK